MSDPWESIGIPAERLEDIDEAARHIRDHLRLQLGYQLIQLDMSDEEIRYTIESVQDTIQDWKSYPAELAELRQDAIAEEAKWSGVKS